ncbi:MAG TPA: hypothetical protein EYP32_01025 [Aquificaceae bacterium]|nr:hypothetical protein [Aquificaceae bacterium]HIQ49461.1 hypothetical protein [Aquifex aeolicus]
MKKFVGLLFVFCIFAFSQPIEIPKDARCVVCGMEVYKYTKFHAQIKMHDGTYKFTESPKHALKFYLQNKDKVKEIWVKDFKTGRWIDGTKAYYVPIHEGPMGMDLAPFKSLVQAKKFAKNRKVFRLKDITLDYINHLDAGMHHRNHHRMHNTHHGGHH